MEPEDIQVLYKKIRNHAINWNEVEIAVQSESNNLEITAGNITIAGKDILDILGEMPAVQKIKTLDKLDKLDKLGEEYQKKLKEITYNNDDHELQLGFLECVESMKSDIHAAAKKTKELETKILNFKVILSGGETSTGTRESGLLGDVELKEKLMKDNNLKQLLENLQTQIDNKKGEVKELIKDYDHYVKMSFTGAAGGLVGLVITGGIFGAKAEKARKRKNQLIDEISSLAGELQNKKSLEAAITTLSGHFLNLKLCMDDASVAVNNLYCMWQGLLENIEESVRQLLTIKNIDRLLSFKTKFEKMIEPWKKIKESASYLSKLFDIALKEYNQSNMTNYSAEEDTTSISPEEPTDMTSIIVFPLRDINYPNVNIHSLKQSINNIKSLAILNSPEIKPIQEIVTNVKIDIIQMESMINKSKSSLEASLSNMNVKSYFATIKELDEALLDTTLDEDSKAEIQAAREEQFTSLKSSLSGETKRFETNSDNLFNKSSKIEKRFIIRQLDNSLISEQEHYKKLSEDILQQEKKRIKLKEDRALIIKNLNNLRQFNLIEMFEKLIPDNEIIDKINISSPEEEVIKQGIKEGIKVIRNVMNKISDGLKYSDFVATREELNAQISDITNTIEKLEKKIKATTILIEDIKAVMQIELEVKTVLIEVNKIGSVWQNFAKKLAELSTSTISEDSVNTILQRQLKFLATLN